MDTTYRWGEVSSRQSAFFFYPETGKPGDSIPRAWNEIPGARGCTPQNCAFRDHYQEFRDLGFQVYGVNSQSLEEQVEFAKLNNLPYDLLNDSDLRLARALRLPTFQFESKTFIKRLAMVVNQSRVEKVFYPVFPPDKNAETVLRYHSPQQLPRRSGLGKILSAVTGERWTHKRRIWLDGYGLT